MEKQSRHIWSKYFVNLILIIFSLSCIFPLIWMFYSSLKEKRVFNADIIGLPTNPTLSNYTKILTNPDYHIYQSMFNSFRVTFLSVVLIVICGFNGDVNSNSFITSTNLYCF